MPHAPTILAAAVALALAAPASGQGPTFETEYFQIRTAPNRGPIGEELAEDADLVLRSVAAQLGVAGIEQAPILVRVLHGDDAFAAAMPHSRVTDWAAGVAFPRSNLILLKIDETTRFEIHDVFRHEISHIVLARAVDHASLPYWFIEGVAVHQAGERIRRRWRRTAAATLTDSLPPLLTIESGFPSDGARVELAYAMSTAFLSYLIELHGWAGIRRVIARMRKGLHFRQSFKNTYGAEVEVIETAWHDKLQKSTSWLAVLLDADVFGTLLWVFAAILLALAAMVVRRRNRTRIAAMPGAPANPDDDEFA